VTEVRAADRAWRRAALAAVVVAVLARFGAALFLGDPLGFHHASGSGALGWDWGYEQAAVAQSIAAGEGFADPFRQGTGATAWAAPAYPLLLGGLIALFGGITAGVAWTALALQALASAATSWFLWRLGRATGGPRLGALAAALWAVHPMAVYLSVSLVWDSTFVAMFLAWFLAALAEGGREPSPRAAAARGALLGAMLLVNPAPLALVPLVAVWLWRTREPGASARRIAALLGVAALVVSPWAIRNAVVLGTPQIRSNLGVEVFVGNNDGARGPFNGALHPAYNASEMERYRELGEVAYSEDALGRGLDWIRANPGAFARLTAVRVQRFWVGPDPRDGIVLGTGEKRRRDWMGWIKWLAHAAFGAAALAGAVLWRGRPGGALLVRGALLLFPLVYYGTHVFERYRLPLEPVVVLAAAGLVLRVFRAGDDPPGDQRTRE